MATSADNARIQLRNPDPRKSTAHLAQSTYAIARRTALAVVPKRAPGITLNAFLDEMKARLPRVKGWDHATSASAGWLAMAIKLDLEARGEIERINDKPPQRLVRV